MRIEWSHGRDLEGKMQNHDNLQHDASINLNKFFDVFFCNLEFDYFWKFKARNK